jgi:hypothetical protein
MVIEWRFKLKLSFDNLEFLSFVEAILQHFFRCPHTIVISTWSKMEQRFYPHILHWYIFSFNGQSQTKSQCNLWVGATHIEGAPIFWGIWGLGYGFSIYMFPIRPHIVPTFMAPLCSSCAWAIGSLIWCH